MKRVTAVLLALAAAVGVARAEYPLRLYEGPWNEDFQQWWYDTDTGFRWATGSITTANQMLRSEVRLKRTLGPATMRFDHLVVSDLIGHTAYDPDAPHSDYGVFQADWHGLSSDWTLSGLLRMNFYKTHGAGGFGVSRKTPHGKLFVCALIRPMADFIAAEDALGHPDHTIRYPTMPFELYFEDHERFGKWDLRLEGSLARTEWLEHFPGFFPSIVNQTFVSQFAALKFTGWFQCECGLAARLLAEARSESFRPLSLYRLRVSADDHFGDASPFYAEGLLRKDIGDWRFEARGHGGFLQWASTEYVADHRDVAGAGLRGEYRFSWWGTFSIQADLEKGYGKHPQPLVVDHAEQLIVILSDQWRFLVEGVYFFELGDKVRTWNLTRFQVLWNF